MTAPAPSANGHVSRRRTTVLWLLLAATASTAFLPPDANPALQAVLAEAQVVFALVHLATWTRARTAALALVVVFAISFGSEWLGVHTGVVFGPYHYSPTMLGPVLSGVPPLVMLAYVSIGYTSFVLARVLACGGAAGYTTPITGPRLVLTALIAGFLATLTDLAFDPINSTVLGEWTWGGDFAYFGVPGQNFVGWVATMTVCAVALGLLVARPATAALVARPVPRGFMAQPVVLYGLFALPIVVNPLLGRTDPVYSAMAVVAGLTGGFVVLVCAMLLTRPTT